MTRRARAASCLPADRRPRAAWWLLGATLLLGCAAPPAPPEPPEPPIADPGPIARVSLSSTAQLLVVGERAPLRATAFDAAGNALPGVVFSWRTQDAAIASVDDSGAILGVAVGSTQVIAEADGVSSAPTLAWVAGVAPGALLFRDEQLVAGPTLLEGGGQLIVGARFQIVLAGVDVPAPDTVVLASQDAPIAGKVTDAAPVADGVAITLEVVPLTDLFVDVDLELRDSVVASTDPAGFAKFDVGGFACETEIEPDLVPAIELAAGVTDTITVDRDVTFVVDSAVLQRALLKVSGNLRLDVGGAVRFPLELKGSLECKQVAGLLRFPFPGPLALVLATKIPLGIGFKAEGSYESTVVRAAAVGFVRADVEAGFEYTLETGLRQISRLTPTHGLKVRWDAPLLRPAATVKASLFPYLFAELKVGHPFSELLGRGDDDLALAELKAGVKGEYELAPPEDQTADPALASKYQVAMHGELSAGADYAALLKLFGIEVETVNLDPPADVALLKSPEGKATVSTTAVVADEPVTLTTNLDPATVEFTDGYNVASLHIWQNDEADGWQEVAELPATDGQTEFEHVWTPTAEDEAAGATEFAVTVETLEMPGVQLEIEPDSRTRVGSALSIELGRRFIHLDVAAGCPPGFCVETVGGPPALPASLSHQNGADSMTMTLSEPTANVLSFDVSYEVSTLSVAQTFVGVTTSRPGTLTAVASPGPMLYAVDGVTTICIGFSSCGEPTPPTATLALPAGQHGIQLLAGVEAGAGDRQAIQLEFIPDPEPE